MTKEIEKAKENQVAEINENQIATYLAGENINLNKNELAYFLQLSKINNLNPFKREIYVIKDKSGKIDFVTGYEVYLKRAISTGLLNGWKVEIAGESPAEAVAVVTIYRKDWEHPFMWEVYGAEFYKPSKSGYGSWDRMWRHMLKVRAISQAFRLAFPEHLGGLPYTQQEIETSGWEKETETETKDLKAKTENLKKRIKKVKKEEKVKEAEIVEENEEDVKRDLMIFVGKRVLDLWEGDKEKARNYVLALFNKELKDLSVEELHELNKEVEGAEK